MSDKKYVVLLPNSNTDTISRIAIIEWLNSTLSSNYTKAEELVNGIAYCQMLEMLFPNCIGIRKLKTNAKLSHQKMHNFKLAQSALIRLGVPKVMPIDRLLRGKFQDHFELLQWFRKFYMVNVQGRDNLQVPQLSIGNPHNKPSTSARRMSSPNETIKISRSPFTNNQTQEEENSEFVKENTCTYQSSYDSDAIKKEIESFHQRSISIVYILFETLQNDPTEDLKKFVQDILQKLILDTKQA